jgi:hypothetical protein
MVIILGKYTKPFEVIDTLTADHRKFPDEFYKKSKFICSRYTIYIHNQGITRYS